jgi:hypothetical protein
MRHLHNTALVLALTLAPLALSAPAGAAAPFDRCPAGHLCLYSESDGTGRVAAFRWGSPDLAHQNLLNPLSAWNRTNRNYCLYTNANYDNHVDTIHPGHKDGLNGHLAYSSVKAC